MKDNQVPEDTIKGVRRDNILRDFNKTGGGQLLKWGKETLINFSAVIRFAYTRQNASRVCRRIVEEVEAYLLTNTRTVLVDNVIVQEQQQNLYCSGNSNDVLARGRENGHLAVDDEETMPYCESEVDRSCSVNGKS